VPQELSGKKVTIKADFDLKPIDTVSKSVEVLLQK
jgi:hypothetical protein